MDNQNLLVRVVAAGLPLIVIALVAGAIGYATTRPETTPIPPFAGAEARVPAANGAITSISAGQITLVTDTGASLSYTLPAGVTVEVLAPISLTTVQVGDWLNGGAIAHPDTVLALENLIVLPYPVTP